MSSPRLWSALGEIVVPQEEDHEALFLHRVRTPLERSHPHPISFSFYPGPPSPSGSTPLASAVLQLLTAVSSRWEHVDLTINAYVRPALEGIRGKLPMLRSLKFGYQEGYYQAVDNPLAIDHFMEAPLLRSAKVVFPNTWSAAHWKENFKLPWAQLTQFQEDVYGHEVGFFPVISNSPGLRSYECTMRPVFATQIDQPPHLHRFLTQFHFTIMTANGTGLLHHLQFPALSDLSISSLEDPSIYDSVHILVTNSACKLHRLKVLNFSRNWDTGVDADGAFIRMLESCPDLEHLSANVIPKGAFERLSASTHDSVIIKPTLVPLLRTLSLLHKPWSHIASLNAVARARDAMFGAGAAPKLAVMVDNTDLGNGTYDETMMQVVLSELEGYPRPVAAPQMKTFYRWCRVLTTVWNWSRQSLLGRIQLGYYMAVMSFEALCEEMEAFDIRSADLRLLYVSTMHKVRSLVFGLIR